LFGGIHAAAAAQEEASSVHNMQEGPLPLPDTMQR
jgi:hypothetical protein